jgi:hypothetical protein
MTEKVTPWLNDEKANIDFELWNRYKLEMQEKRPVVLVNDLDDFTDKILDKCVNPKETKSFDRRGMVVGHVQSGKTSNYVGFINKATDAGYKVIIVIAGTISSLADKHKKELIRDILEETVLHSSEKRKQNYWRWKLMLEQIFILYFVLLQKWR